MRAKLKDTLVEIKTLLQEIENGPDDVEVPQLSIEELEQQIHETFPHGGHLPKTKEVTTHATTQD